MFKSIVLVGIFAILALAFAAEENKEGDLQTAEGHYYGLGHYGRGFYGGHGFGHGYGHGYGRFGLGHGFYGGYGHGFYG